MSHITSRRNSVSSVDNEEQTLVVGGHDASVPDAEVSAIADAVPQHLSIVTRELISGQDSSSLSSPGESSASSVASSSSSISVSSSASSASYLYPSHDQTVEILMTNLNPEAMKLFYQRPDDVAGTVGGVRVDQETGLAGLFPQAQLDSFLFTPCGYSANALQEGNYYTIHVTPEPVCSYASFETNIPVGLRQKSSKSRGRTVSGESSASVSSTSSENGDASEEEKFAKAETAAAQVPYTGPETLTDLISRVVEIFQPGTMSVTLFSSHLTEDGQMETERQTERRQRHMVKAMGRVSGFTRTDRILYEFDGCDLVFGHFVAKA